MKAKEMVFNVEPGATPRGPKHLNRTVGFSILKDVLLFDIFYLKAPALLETLTRLSAYKLSKSCLSFILRTSSSLLRYKAIQGRLPAKIKNPSRPGIGELVISYKSH